MLLDIQMELVDDHGWQSGSSFKDAKISDAHNWQIPKVLVNPFKNTAGIEIFVLDSGRVNKIPPKSRKKTQADAVDFANESPRMQEPDENPNDNKEDK